jgi:uncharacterized membrane protein YoaK (UPF0700 family)
MTTRLKYLREAVLMILTFSSGAVDAICFVAFGKVFTAFMTGNLVFLGIGAANAFKPNGPNLVRVGVVIAAFVVGVFIAARIAKRLRRSRVAGRGFAASLAGVLIAQLVFLAGWIAVSGDPSSTFATALAAVEAVAMGMQSSAVGSLDVKSVFTTAATATLINLSREAADRRVSDTDPWRMARIIICLIAGATAGGLLLVNARTYAPVLSTLATAAALGVNLQARREARLVVVSSGAVATTGDSPRVTGDPAAGYGEAA